MGTENNQHPLPLSHAKIQEARGVVQAELVADAALDPCMPIRNLAGHFVTCNFGDWADFSKCKCLEGLLTAPTKATAMVVAPMPLRDILASSIHVSDEVAAELAWGIRKELQKDQKIQTVGGVLGVSEDDPLTIMELADARAKIRYLEADAMIHWRAQSLRLKAEAEAKAKAGEKLPGEPSRIILPGSAGARGG